MSALSLTPSRRALLERLEKTSREFTNISPENGAFLHWMTHATGAKRVVEVGGSNGYSAIFFGMALESVGGRLVSLEKDAERVAMARQNLEEAGLSGWVEVREGDALDLIQQLDGEWDLAFLDAEKGEYRRYAEALLPKIRTGGVLLADDTRSMRSHMLDFVEWAYHTPEVEACDVSIDDGLILCWKRG
jgi:predicted O-methyltransferase YrrM